MILIILRFPPPAPHHHHHHRRDRRRLRRGRLQEELLDDIRDPGNWLRDASPRSWVLQSLCGTGDGLRLQTISFFFLKKSHFQKLDGFGVSSQVLHWKNPRKVAWIQHCHCQCHDDKHHHDGEHHHSHDDGGHNHDHDHHCWRPSAACSHKIM